MGQCAAATGNRNFRRWLRIDSRQLETRDQQCGKRVFQAILLILTLMSLTVSSGCSTVGKVGRDLGAWGTDSSIRERFEALCAEVGLRPHLDVRLVLADELKGAWASAEKQGGQYFVTVSLKKLQWQPEMIEPVLRHEMAHILAGDFTHGDKWAAACKRLGVAATVSEPVGTVYASRTHAGFSSQRMR